MITDLIVLGTADGVTVVPQVDLERYPSLEYIRAALYAQLGVEVVMIHPGIWGLGKTLPVLPIVFEVVAHKPGRAENADAYLPPLARPWQRPGWFRKASSWIADTLAARGERLTGKVQVSSTYDRACVLRADTDGGGVYFKAGEVGEHEAAVTVRVAQVRPQLTPDVLAADGDRNWLLTRDCGAHLSRCGDLGVWQEALGQLASFYLDSDPAVLTDEGCPHHPFSELAERAEGFIRGPDTLERWGLERPQRAALAELLPTIRRAHTRVRALDLPDGATHGDAQPMNALWSGRGVVWFDWSEASVTHPLLDVGWCLNWLEHPRRKDLPLKQAHPAAATELWSSYLRALGVSAPTQSSDIQVLALIHRALAYHERLADWQSSVTGWFPEYVPYYLEQLIRLVARGGSRR